MKGICPIDFFLRSPSATKAGGPAPGRRGGFTLLEVMVAVAIFFLAIFAILDMTARNIRAARDLQQFPPNFGSLAAELSLTNRLEEGTSSGDFGERYPGYNWQENIYEVATNGLFEVDFIVSWPAGERTLQSTSSVLFYRPLSRTTFTGPGIR